MRLNKEIALLLKKLVDTHLTIGIQPSELVEAAFEDPYKKIEIVKKNSTLEVLVTFLDDDPDPDAHTIIKMRYIYALDKRLMRIDEKAGNKKFKTQWDREQFINDLINELRSELLIFNSSEDVEKVLSTIPDEIKVYLRQRLALVA